MTKNAELDEQLLKAVLADDLVKLQSALSSGAKAEWRTGTNPLHVACYHGSHKCAAALLQHGANARATYTYGATPLHLAAREGRILCTKVLLQSNADVYARDRWGSTPLHLAARYNHPTSMKEMLQRSAYRINVPDADGDTPLHDASARGHAACVNVLLAMGANADVVNKAGQSPLDICTAPAIKRVLQAALQLQQGGKGKDIAPSERMSNMPKDSYAMGRGEQGEVVNQGLEHSWKDHHSVAAVPVNGKGSSGASPKQKNHASSKHRSKKKSSSSSGSSSSKRHKREKHAQEKKRSHQSQKKKHPSHTNSSSPHQNNSLAEPLQSNSAALLSAYLSERKNHNNSHHAPILSHADHKEALTQSGLRASASNPSASGHYDSDKKEKLTNKKGGGKMGSAKESPLSMSKVGKSPSAGQFPVSTRGNRSSKDHGARSRASSGDRRSSRTGSHGSSSRTRSRSGSGSSRKRGQMVKAARAALNAAGGHHSHSDKNQGISWGGVDRKLSSSVGSGTSGKRNPRIVVQSSLLGEEKDHDADRRRSSSDCGSAHIQNPRATSGDPYSDVHGAGSSIIMVRRPVHHALRRRSRSLNQEDVTRYLDNFSEASWKGDENQKRDPSSQRRHRHTSTSGGGSHSKKGGLKTSQSVGSSGGGHLVYIDGSSAGSSGSRGEDRKDGDYVVSSTGSGGKKRKSKRRDSRARNGGSSGGQGSAMVEGKNGKEGGHQRHQSSGGMAHLTVEIPHSSNVSFLKHNNNASTSSASTSAPVTPIGKTGGGPHPLAMLTSNGGIHGPLGTGPVQLHPHSRNVRGVSVRGGSGSPQYLSPVVSPPTSPLLLASVTKPPLSPRVQKLLEEEGLIRYSEVFRQEEITFPLLLRCTDSDLGKIGLPLGARLHLLERLQKEQVLKGNVRGEIRFIPLGNGSVEANWHYQMDGNPMTVAQIVHSKAEMKEFMQKIRELKSLLIGASENE